MDSANKRITLTYGQAWSIASGIAVGVFVLSMIYASFIDVRTTQQNGLELFESFKESLEEELKDEKKHQDFLYKETNGRLDRKTQRNEDAIDKMEIRIKKIEHGIN